MDKKLLFPKYLNKGSKGPAVLFLQYLLMAGGFSDAIVPDGEYGDVTAEAVSALQAQLGVEEDGNFGPATRATWLEELGGPNVNAILTDAFTGETVAVGPQ